MSKWAKGPNLVLFSILIMSEISRSSQFNFFNGQEEEGPGYTSYNRVITCSPSAGLHFPQSIEEVLALVQYAIKNNLRVKAIGSGHSASDALCTDGLAIDMHGINHMTWNADDKTVTVGTGALLEDLLKFLDSKGRGLTAMPTFGGITVGGGICMGVHGSSLKHQSTLSDQTVSMKVIDGLGNIQLIDQTQDLRAFRVNLGLLAVIVEVTLVTVPQYKVHVVNYEASEDILSNGVALSMARTSDFTSFWWLPNDKSVVVGDGNYVDISVPGLANTNLVPNVPRWETALFRTTIEVLQEFRKRPGLEFFEEYVQHSLYQFTIGKPSFYTENGGKRLVNPAVGLSHRIMSSSCSVDSSASEVCVWKNGKLSMNSELFSFAMDVEQLPALVEEVKQVLQIAPAEFPLISIYLRFNKATDTFMAVENYRDTVHIEITLMARADQYTSPKMGLDAVQAIVQAWVYKLGARAHWAKAGLHYFNKDLINRDFSDRPLFIEAMKKFDPNGLFLNDFGRRVLGESDKQTIDPRVTHCALQDYCLCQKDSDCATSQTCTTLRGYPVCKDRSYLSWMFNLEPVVTNLRLSFISKSHPIQESDSNLTEAHVPKSYLDKR